MYGTEKNVFATETYKLRRENSKYEAMNVDWVKESDTKLVNSAILLHFAFNMCNLRYDSHSVANPPIQYIRRT